MFCGRELAESENEEGQRLSKRSEEPSTQTHDKRICNQGEKFKILLGITAVGFCLLHKTSHLLLFNNSIDLPQLFCSFIIRNILALFKD